MNIKLINEKKDGKNYQADVFKILYRDKGSIAGDNSINPEELIYLISGKAEVTLQNSTEVIDAPAKIKFPARTYHKIKSLSNIAFIIFEN